jgi:hydrocephalus-inducing protein
MKPNDRPTKKTIKLFNILTPNKMYKDEQDGENLLENMD